MWTERIKKYLVKYLISRNIASFSNNTVGKGGKKRGLKKLRTI